MSQYRVVGLNWKLTRDSWIRISPFKDQIIIQLLWLSLRVTKCMDSPMFYWWIFQYSHCNICNRYSCPIRSSALIFKELENVLIFFGLWFFEDWDTTFTFNNIWRICFRIVHRLGLQTKIWTRISIDFQRNLISIQ